MNIRKLKADLDWFVIRNTPWLPIAVAIMALVFATVLMGRTQ